MDNTIELRKKILEITRPGPLSQWVDRIGILAANSGIKMEMINWNNSPFIVAHEVIKKAKDYDVLDKLTNIVEDLDALDQKVH